MQCCMQKLLKSFRGQSGASGSVTNLVLFSLFATSQLLRQNTRVHLKVPDNTIFSKFSSQLTAPRVEKQWILLNVHIDNKMPEVNIYGSQFKSISAKRKCQLIESKD